MARLRIGTVKVRKDKGLSAQLIKGVAGRLASYADPDGSRVHPGVARLAYDQEISYNAAQDATAWLAAAGLITKVGRKGKAGAIDWQLTIPTDLLERFKVDDPDEADRAIRAIRDQHESTRPRRPRPTPPSPASPPAALDHPQDGAPAGAGDVSPPSGGQPPAVSPPSSGRHSTIPRMVGPSTDQHTTTTSHPQLTLVTNGEVPREQAPKNRIDHVQGGKCPEHPYLAGGELVDGRPACPICRRATYAGADPLDLRPTCTGAHRAIPGRPCCRITRDKSAPGSADVEPLTYDQAVAALRDNYDRAALVPDNVIGLGSRLLKTA